MATATAQNATDLSVSTPKELDYSALVLNHATRNVSGMTGARFSLNREKLVKKVTRHVKSLRGIDPTKDLPADLFNKCTEAIDKFIDGQLKTLTAGTLISSKRVFKYTQDDGFVANNIVTSEEVLTTKEEKFACLLKLNQCKTRLQKLYDNGSVDATKITQAKAAVESFQMQYDMLGKAVETENAAMAESVKQ